MDKQKRITLTPSCQDPLCLLGEKTAHDTHCAICGTGQWDLTNKQVKPEYRTDDMSWCGTCGADICGGCDCGHDNWGA